MPFHISTSTRAVAGSSTIYDDIKTPCLRSLWTDYGIKVIGCFIFAETLLAGSPVAPIPPSHTSPPLRRRLDIIQKQGRLYWRPDTNVESTFSLYIQWKLTVIWQNIYNLDYGIQSFLWFTISTTSKAITDSFGFMNSLTYAKWIYLSSLASHGAITNSICFMNSLQNLQFGLLDSVIPLVHN